MTTAGNSQLTLAEHIDRLHERITDLGGGGDRAPMPMDELLAELASAHEELLVADEEVRSQQEELERLLAARGETRRVQERFLALLPAAVVVTDAAGTITFANAAAGAMLGAGLDKLVSKPLVAFVDAGDRRAVRDFISGAAAGSATSFRRPVVVHSRVVPALQVELTATKAAAEPGHGHGHGSLTWALVTNDTEVTTSGGSVARALLGMAQLPIATSDRDQVLKSVAVLCSEAFDLPVDASVNVGPPSAPEIVASSSEVAQRLDGAQMMAAEGPCQEAWDLHVTVHSAEIGADERWPRFGPRARDIGIRAALGVPVRTAGSAGCVNLYSEDARLVEPEHVRTAEMLAAGVAAVLHETDLKNELAAVAEQLHRALESRAVIDQAKGIIMARQRCDAEEAFRLLVRLSSTRNVKLRQVATMLVDEVTSSS